MDYLSTRQVARLLGVSVSLLTKAVWCGRVDPPQKSPAGDFLWTFADIERASWVLLHKPFGKPERGSSMNTTERAARHVATTAGTAEQTSQGRVCGNRDAASRARLQEELGFSLLRLVSRRPCTSTVAEFLHALRAYADAREVQP